MDSSLAATPDLSGFCPRCDRDVRTVRPWPHWRRVQLGFYGVLVLAALLSPMLMMDACMLIPVLIIFFSALGPLNGLAAQKPTCARCGGLAVDPPRRIAPAS